MSVTIDHLRMSLNWLEERENQFVCECDEKYITHDWDVNAHECTNPDCRAAWFDHTTAMLQELIRTTETLEQLIREKGVTV